MQYHIRLPFINAPSWFSNDMHDIELVLQNHIIAFKLILKMTSNWPLKDETDDIDYH